jgi:hypothetical protein
MRAGAVMAGMAATALAAGAAGAATTSPQVMTVAGNAPQICAVQNPVVGEGALINFRSLNGTTLQIDQLADPKTLATSAAVADVRFSAVCNYPHRITLESDNNGLWRGGSAGSTPPSGFADGVPYTASLVWGQVTDKLEADATSRRINDKVIPVGQATAGDIQIRVAIQAGATNLSANAPLIAGVYSDTLRVTVEPQ